jgi:multiple sugar transport system permease protein
MAVTSTIENPALARSHRSSPSSSRLAGSDRLWALAFATPYVLVFLAFVIYPIAFGLWLGSDPATYRQLFTDPVYPSALRNTLIYLLVAVNLKLFLALLLSGFFMRKGWWTKTLLLIFILPWAVPAIPGYISIHWMLNGQWGLVNNVIWSLWQTDGPPWLDNANLALGSVIYAHIWKWLPFWTIIFLAGRMAIPTELFADARHRHAYQFHDRALAYPAGLDADQCRPDDRRHSHVVPRHPVLRDHGKIRPD